MSSKWMADVKGFSDVNVVAVVKRLADSSMQEALTAEGGLLQAVHSFIEKHGYRISDSGGGACGWHLGVPFDDLDDACEYLHFITSKFYKAIGYGMLRIELKSWSPDSWK